MLATPVNVGVKFSMEVKMCTHKKYVFHIRPHNWQQLKTFSFNQKISLIRYMNTNSEQPMNNWALTVFGLDSGFIIHAEQCLWFSVNPNG